MGQNIGGLIPKVHFGFHSDVLNWPTRPLNQATLEANAVLISELVMKAGSRLFRLYITDDTGEFSIKPVVEID